MKKFIYIAVIGLLMGCSGDGDEPGNPDSGSGTNNGPSAPTLAEPTNGLLCIDNNLTFSWGESTDPEGDAIKYKIEVALDNQFTQITHSANNLTTTTRTFLLDRDLIYYWRVKAVDSKNASGEFSSTFELYTEGHGVENYLPFPPKLLAPDMGSITQGNSTLLTWGSNDVDGDSLTFDIYLDTNASPTTVVVADHPDKNYIASSLLAGTTYYWKVVAKDGNGGVSIGQVWSFTTE